MHIDGKALCCLALAAAGFGVPAAAQAQWQARTPAQAPVPRAGHALVQDRARGQVLLFGGLDLNSPGCCVRNDTWVWDGQTWIQRNPAHAPPARSSPAACYDSARGRVVLFGGGGVLGALADTWEWDGSDWIACTAGSGPSPRYLSQMVYDAARGVTVLFGGGDGTAYFDDTWVWNGTAWNQIGTAIRPPARAQHALAYDAAASEVFLFGGDRGSVTYDDTWIWTGQAWTQRFPARTPGRLWSMGCTYDTDRGRVVLFGGFNGANVADTWEWNGTTYELRGTLAAPSGRSHAGLAYDARRGECVLFGGMTVTAGSALGDTWVYRVLPAANYLPFGKGCPGSAGTPLLEPDPLWATRPWLGATFGLVVRNAPSGTLAPLVLFGASRTAWPPLQLPLDLGPVGMPGCTLLASGEFALPTLRSGPDPSVALAIPFDPALLGGLFFNQAVVVDPGANPAGLTFSNAGQATIGAR